jgi:hypothetical protein
MCEGERNLKKGSTRARDLAGTGEICFSGAPVHWTATRGDGFFASPESTEETLPVDLSIMLLAHVSHANNHIHIVRVVRYVRIVPERR